MINGWEIAKLKNVLDYIQPTKYIVESTNYSNDYKTPVLTAGKSFIIGYTKEKNNIFRDLPAIIFDDFTTAIQFVNFEFKVKSSAMKILVPTSPLVDVKYVFYFMKTLRVNTDTHKRYWISIFSQLPIKIPSPFEQKEIVSKIEQLFSDLDNTIDNLEKAKDQLKVYRQSALKYAFKGRIVPFNSIENNLLGDIVKVKGGKRLPKGEKVQDEKTACPYIRVVDFKDFSINLHSLKYIKEHVQKRISRYVIFKDEVFISIAGTIGRVGMIPEKLNGANLTENAAKITDIENILPRYLMYYLASPEIQDKISYLKKATSQPKLALYRIESIKLKYPKDINLQQQVIQEIESRFSVCNKTEETINSSLEQAEALRQSILKQAFEGKLTEDWRKNHPDLISGENSAKALLERIKKEREALKNTKKRKK